MTYKRIILNHLKDLRDFGPDEGWIKAGMLRSKETKHGFIGFRGDRDVRDLVKSGLLEADKDGKYRIVRYKYPTPKSPEEKEKERQEMLKFSMM